MYKGGQTLVPIRIVAFHTRFPSVQLLMQAAETWKNKARGFCDYGTTPSPQVTVIHLLQATDFFFFFL